MVALAAESGQGARSAFVYTRALFGSGLSHERHDFRGRNGFAKIRTADSNSLIKREMNR